MHGNISPLLKWLEYPTLKNTGQDNKPINNPSNSRAIYRLIKPF
jgi:hypothetical protein